MAKYISHRIIGEILLCGLGAAAFFWIPDIVVHFATGKGFDRSSVLLITVLCPALTFLWGIAVCVPRTQLPKMACLLIALFAIWVTGPSMMTLAATPTGAGFAKD